MVRHTYKGRNQISRNIGRRPTKGRRKITRRRRGQKRAGGGVRYGTGIGSNCHDPNQSIFNTNLLKLFPYKP